MSRGQTSWYLAPLIHITNMQFHYNLKKQNIIISQYEVVCIVYNSLADPGGGGGVNAPNAKFSENVFSLASLAIHFKQNCNSILSVWQKMLKN